MSVTVLVPFPVTVIRLPTTNCVSNAVPEPEIVVIGVSSVILPVPVVDVDSTSATVTTSDDLTGHFSVGDAIKIVNTDPVESSTYIVTAITASTITLDGIYAGITDNGMDGSVTVQKDGDLFIVRNGVGDDKVVVDQSGSVGIGTITPGPSIGMFDKVLHIESGDNPGLVLTNTGGGLGSGGEHYLHTHSDGSFAILDTILGLDSFVIDGTGDVFIGPSTLDNSSPAVDLSVAGNLEVDGFIYGTLSGFSVGDNNPSIVFDVATASDTDFWLGVQDDGGMDDNDVFQIGDGTTPGTNPFLTIDTNGNVGIGTITPSAALDVTSSAFPVGRITRSLTGDRSDSAGTLLLNYETTGNALDGFAPSLHFSLSDSGVSDSILGRMVVQRDGADTSGKIVLSPYNAGTPVEVLALTKEGNVGIGTAMPGAKLDVSFSGTTDFSASDEGTWNAMRLVNSSAGLNDSVGIIFNPDDGTDGAGIVGIHTHETNSAVALAFITDPDGAAQEERMRITSDGKVGIGTTSPSVEFHVSNAGPVAALIESTDSYAQLQLKGTQGEDVTWGLLSGFPNAGDFTIRESTVANYLTIKKTTGYVGIGTTGPVGKLDVDLGPALTGTVEINGTTTVAGTGTNFTSALSVGEYIVIDGESREVATIPSDTSLTVSSAFSNSTSGLEIAKVGLLVQNGNVGIGTAAPQGLLHISGGPSGASVDEILQLGPTDISWTTGENYTVAFGVNDGTVNREIAGYLTGNHDGSTYSLTMGSLGELRFATGATGHLAGASSVDMTIDGTGKVGIGTTSPSDILHVGPDSLGDAIIRLEANTGRDAAVKLYGDRDWHLQVDGDSSIGPEDTFHIRDVTAGQSRLVINTSGNVGIGTTSPATALSVFEEDGSDTGVIDVLTLTRETSAVGNGAVGIGVGMLFTSENTLGGHDGCWRWNRSK